MSLDHTWLLNRGRAMLGQFVTGRYDFQDQDMLALLEQETLPTFSIYLPWLYDVEVDIVRDQLPGREGVYQLRRAPGTIIGISRLMEGVGAFGAFPYDPLLFGDVVDRQLVSDRQSMSVVEMTWKFTPPNVVEVFPKGLTYQNFHFETKLVHPTHLKTVPFGARETLRELFLADLAIDVLTVRQYFQSLQTVFGEMNLNLERLQQHADKRQDIVDKLEQKQHKSGGARRLWIA
jgi:hypothetical protein